MISAYVYRFWDPLPISFGICIDKAGNITNCTASFTFTPSTLFAGIGVTVSSLTELAALDNKSIITGVPAGLMYTADDGGSTLMLDKGTGLATTIGASPLFIPTTVQVTDPESGAFGTYKVTVVSSPKIQPNPAMVSLGQQVKLTLTDGNGNPIAVPDGTEWSSSDKTILNCVLEIAGGISCGGGASTTFSGIAQGSATVTAANAKTGFSTSVTVQVGNPPEFWGGTYQITGCNDPHTVGTGGPALGCAFALGAPTPSGQLAVAFGTLEANNIRRDYVWNIEFCSSYSIPLDINATSTFTLPIDDTGVLLPSNVFPGPIINSMVFSVTNRSPTQISGTFSADFQDVTSTSPWTAGPASVSGTWALSPRKASFPKCIYPAPAIACLSNNQAWQSAVGQGGTCDFQPFTSPGRPGEWAGLP